VVVFLLLFFTACGKTKLLTNPIPSPYLNYDRIKLSLTVDRSQYHFKGFIHMIKDTSACFRFWGPLGYEIGRGQIGDSFTYYDALNNLNYKDLKQQMENSSGLILNKSILLYLLSGKVDLLASELLKLNRGILSVKESNNHYLELEHSVSHQTITFKYTFIKGIPAAMDIKSKGSGTIFELKLEINDISLEKKICRFNE
jgi:hypothetical protein